MTKKHVFRPNLGDVLEDRVALSQIAAVPVAAVDSAAVRAATATLKQKTLNDVNRSVDTAFNRFNKEYATELKALNRSGNSQQFQVSVNQSVSRLRTSLAGQAARIPGGSSTLNTELQQRVDSLVHDLQTNKSVAPSNLIKADESGAHADVGTFVHDQVSRGDLSLR
jgi:hypothetical protein